MGAALVALLACAGQARPQAAACASCCPILRRTSRAARHSLPPLMLRRSAVMALWRRTGIQVLGPRKASVGSLRDSVCSGE